MKNFYLKINVTENQESAEIVFQNCRFSQFICSSAISERLIITIYLIVLSSLYNIR